MKKSKTSLRILSLLLCLSMILGMAPMIQLFTHAKAADPDPAVTKCEGHSHEGAVLLGTKGSSTAVDVDPTTAFTQSGTYVLQSNIRFRNPAGTSGTASINQKIHICLNGFKITSIGSNLFGIATNGELTICDCSAGHTGEIYSAMKNVSGSVFSLSGGKLHLYGGTITGNETKGRGGAVFVNAGASEFHMHGGKITGSKTVGASLADVVDGAWQNGSDNGAGGAIFIQAGKFYMSGGEISGNSSSLQGGAIYIKSGTIEISGGKICNNTAATNGGAIYLGNGLPNVTISGGAIDNNKAASAGGIHVNTGKVTLTNGKISNNSATGSYGGVFVAGGANNSFTMTGGEVSGNSAASGGGAIGQTAAKVYIKGGSVSNNTALNGGAFQVNSASGELHISGGKITGNKTSADTGVGSVIHSNNSIVNISGGEISGNIGTHTINISKSVLTMSGGKIDGNYKTAAKTAYAGLLLNNYIAPTTATFSGSAVVGDAGISIGKRSGVADATAIVQNLSEGASILFAAGTLVNVDTEDTTIAKEGDDKYVYNIPWVSISGEQPAFEAGKYYKLTGNVNLTSSVSIAGNVTIDLAGKEITGAVAPYFKVAPDAKLTVMDSSAEKTGKIIGLAETANSQQPMILLDCNWSASPRYGGTLILNGGTLTGHHRMGGANVGGAILAQNASTVIMNGGAITNNVYASGDNSKGAAIGTGTDASIVINGGEITGNNGKNGGAILVAGPVTVNDGNISGNTATNGGVFSLTGTGSVTINGGTFKNNTATTGSVAHTNASVGITMTGGKIEGNYGGSTFVVSGTKFTMSGGVIDGNYKDTTKTVKATLSINNYVKASEGVFSGTAVVGDAGVYVPAAGTGNYTNASKASVGNLSKGASILFVKNTATSEVIVDANDDSVVSVEANGTVCYTFKNPDPLNIQGEVSTLESGEYNLTGDVTLTGNVAISGSVTIDLKGHKIVGATAPYFTVAAGASLTIKDTSAEQTGVIQGLTATDVLIRVNGVFNFEGGTITGHKHNGKNTLGTIYGASSSAITISGGKITGNNAVRGGAIYNNGGKLTINGGEISGNTATYGGAIFGACSKDGSVLSNIVINGGKIANNTASDSGGGMYVSGNLTINGGEITGNSAKNYGAIAAAATNFVAKGGYIHDNESEKSAADVNLSTTSAGGAPASTASTCDISGAPVITDTFTSQTEIVIHDLKYGAEVHTLKLAQTAEDDDSIALKIDVTAGENIYISTQEKTWCDEDHSDREGWIALTQSKLDSMVVADAAGTYYKLAAGKYFLTGDLTIDKTIVVNSQVHLDLNSYDIISAANASYAYLIGSETCVTMIMLNGGSQKLQLCDSAGGGKIDASAYTGTKLKAIVRVNNGATFNMYGGILTGNKNSTIEGSAVFLTYKSIFNMYGGSITGNKTTHYGTVFVGTNTSSFTMYGGSISNNEVGRGGAVASTTGYAENARASITIKGGTIENNKAQYGGVIYAPVAGGKNNNGTITYNSTYGAKVTIEGGTFQNNSASGQGSVFYGSNLKVTGGLFEKNVFTGSGTSGAFYVTKVNYNNADFGSFEMSGGTVRDNGDTYSVYVNGSPVAISGATYIDSITFTGTGAIADLEEGAYVNSNKALTVKTGDPSVAVEGSFVYTYKKPISCGIYITVPAGNGYEYFAVKDLIQVADHNKASDVSTQLGLAIAEATADKTILNNATIKWTSSDESVAKVTDSGVVTYGKWGNAVITATIVGTEYYASINIQVGQDPLKVLIIGNSFSRDSLYYLSTLGLYTDNRITAGYLYEGSATIRDHAKNLMTGGTYTYCKTDAATGEMQLSSEGTQVTIPQALQDEDWDYVVLQHGVLNSGYTPTYNSDLEYLVDYIESVVDSDTKLFWNMTWAIKDGMSLDNKGLKFADVYNGSQKIMYNAIIDAMDQFIVGDDAPYSSVNANNLGSAKGWGFDGYFFTGAAIQQLREVADIEPTRDGYHLSHVNGRVTAALSVLKALQPELDLDAIDENDGLIDAINAEKEDENYSKYAAEEDLDAAALARIITAVKNAYVDVTDSDKLPTKLAHNDETKPTTAEGVITLGIVDAPLKLHFADIAYAGNEVFTAGYESVVHVTGSTQTNSTHLMQEGAGKLIIWKGNKNFTNAQWQASYENDPLLVIDEAWIQSKGLVPNDGAIYGRYDALQEGKTVYVLADPRDPNLVAGMMDVTGDAEKEEVVLFTFWVNYHNNAGAIVDRTCYLMYTYDGGDSWSEPYPIYIDGVDRGYNPAKRGDIAIYEDNHILIPVYSSLYAIELAFNKTVGDWEHIASRVLTNHATYETTTLNEISFVAMKYNGMEVTYRMDRESGVVMISYDRGATWEEVGNEKGLIHQPGFTVIDEDTIYASWARTKSPRSVYGTVYDIYGEWDSTPTVLVYESGVQNGSHDMGDPSCAYLGDNQVGVVAYDTAYRSIVMCIEDITSDEYQPFVLTETGDKITYTDKLTDLPIDAPDVAYIIEATLTAAGQIKTPSGTISLEAGSVKLAVIGQVIYKQNTDGTWITITATAGTSDGKIYADSSVSAVSVYTYARISLQESLDAIWGGRPIQLTYSIDPEGYDVAFKSSDSSVVTVDNNGLVSIVDEGTATITMTVQGQVEKTCTVRVAPKPLELSDDGEKVIIMQDDYEEDKYEAGENALWNDYWADKENSFYLFENADNMNQTSNGNIHYDIVDDGNGNQYLKVSGAGNSWMATAMEIAGDYTVEFDVLFTHPSAETGGYGQLNLTPWQNDLRNGGSNEIHGFVNLHVNKYRFQFREKSLWEDKSTSSNPNLYCYGNNIITDSATVWDQSSGQVNVWQHVKLSRVNGGLFLKLWQGDTEPEAWTCMLSHSVLETDMASHFRMQFQSDATRAVYVDNLVVSHRMRNPVDITIVDGDTTVSKVTVEAGTKIEMPADPNKENHTFVGWFNGDAQWNFEDAVTEDMVLTAKYQIHQYTVAFDSGVAAQTVAHGNKATKPADPVKEGYTFVGWYNGETAYDFDTVVTGSIVLTAKWTINKYTVTFDSGVAAQTVEHGAKATKPADPTKEGYVFVGWYNGETAYDFDAVVTGSITLTAKWTPVQSENEPTTQPGTTTPGGAGDEPSKTGDETLLLTVLLMATLSFGALAVVVIGKKKLF